MKISNSTPNYINQTYSQSKPNTGGIPAAKQEKTYTESSGDSIQLSSKTKDLQRISKAFDVEPASRQEMVARLKESVQQNQYTVDAEKVAQKMAGMLMDELI